jgi:SOS response regulatory protein OraA/RecX
MENSFNAVKGVEDISMLKYYQNTRRYVKRYFNQRERFSIQQLKGKLREKGIKNLTHLNLH